MEDSSALTSINALVTDFFRAFDNRTRSPSLESLLACFTDGALVTRRLESSVELYSVAEFALPRMALLGGGTLQDFCEFEVSASTEIFGGVAARISQYRKSGTLNAQPFTGGGTKLFHLVETSGAWKICSLTWIDGNV